MPSIFNIKIQKNSINHLFLKSVSLLWLLSFPSRGNMEPNFHWDVVIIVSNLICIRHLNFILLHLNKHLFPIQRGAKLKRLLGWQRISWDLHLLSLLSLESSLISIRHMCRQAVVPNTLIEDTCYTLLSHIILNIIVFSFLCVRLYLYIHLTSVKTALQQNHERTHG